MEILRGTFRALIFYDVADEIRLDKVRECLGELLPTRRPDFRGQLPTYAGPERPPVTCPIEDVELEPGHKWSCVLRFYDHGVLSIALERPINAGWSTLLALGSRWVGAPEIELAANKIAREQVAKIHKALVRPYEDWTTEDYHVIHLHTILGGDGHPLTAAELVAQHGGEVACVVRGESAPLSEREINEVLRDSMSYYTTDFLVIGWTAALIYDTLEGAAPVLDLLEYANAQLVEFRHYDNVMTRLLNAVYDGLERRRAHRLRWRSGRDAEALNRMRLEVIELTESLDNSVKFLSDMFYARVFRIAAQRIGVTDYRALVDEKLRTAGELYHHMESEFHQFRAFLLEFMIVAILIIDLALLLTGRQ
jgi:hypothetical protein